MLLKQEAIFTDDLYYDPCNERAMRVLGVKIVSQDNESLCINRKGGGWGPDRKDVVRQAKASET